VTARTFDRLVEKLSFGDDVQRARSADAAEKASSKRPELLARHKRALLRLLAREQRKEVRWHLAQMLPRLSLSAAERRDAARVLMRWCNTDPSAIVRVCALQALCGLADVDARFRAAALRHVSKALAGGSPAERARARRLIARLRARG